MSIWLTNEYLSSGLPLRLGTNEDVKRGKPLAFLMYFLAKRQKS